MKKYSKFMPKRSKIICGNIMRKLKLEKRDLNWSVAIVTLSCLVLSSCNSADKADEFPPLFPFVISYDGPDNVSSMAHLLDAPAGRHGFTRIESGRFINDAGPVRLNATNLTGQANFPTHGQADSLAARLARFGINCVRLHHMDTYWKWLGLIANDPSTQRNFDPAQVELLDYMIATFKKQGIYVNINLHVGRFWNENDGFRNKDKRPYFDKGLDNFEPRMIELQKEYAKKLLTHINPYTGLAYTDDPCVAMVEINNENALFNQYHRGTIDTLPEPYATELQNQWNNWLSKKYSSTDILLKTWKWDDASSTDNKPVLSDKTNRLESKTIPIVTTTDSVTNAEKRDFYQFLVDTEQSYWSGMYNYLKNDLKVKSIISGTQLGYSPPFVQAQLDYIDSHSYWRHPSGKNLLHDRYNWKIKNESMVNTMSTIQRLAAQKILGKPYTVSEYNHPFPNQYGAEGQPMLCAYGSLQGWDGVFQYTYNHDPNFTPNINPRYFDMIGRTDVLAHLPACAAIFLRGDVQEAKSIIIGSTDYPSYFDRLVSLKTVGINIGSLGFDMRQTLIHKTAIDLSNKFGTDTISVAKITDDQKVIMSDTEELTWNTELPEAGYFTVNTTNTKLFTGFPKEKEIKLGDVKISIGKTRLNWATLSLVSRNANGFGESGPANILLTATGLSENKGMTIEELPENYITIRDKWGKGPVYVEGIPATVTLPTDPTKTKCFALDPGGNRKNEIPVRKTKKGDSKIVIRPEYETIWYEIEIL
jgi:cellulase (glycosyl hydrolase family 5)